MTRHRSIAISDRIREWSRSGNVDCVRFLRSELEQSSNLEEKISICSMLASELKTQGRLQDAEMAIREQIELAPEMADSWISLALHFLYHGDDPAEALSAIDIAVEKAIREGAFYRQAHTERIRIALKLGAYDLVETSLQALVNHYPGSRAQDIKLESEFLELIPTGTVSNEVIESYKLRVVEESIGF